MVNSDAGATVTTLAGRVRGVRAGGVHAFKGVPYGAPTSGTGRFLPPSPVLPWADIRDATHYGQRSPGLAFPPIFMNEEGVDLDMSAEGEDCLVLNIWTAEPSRTAKLPVMVWCHGGGYNSGSGGSVRYDGTRLAAAHGVVVVTVNHRLGALGFLYFDKLGDCPFPGSANVGMQDIVASLEWVRDNIEAFGGDPNNVTVFGESGGGGKVSTLMAMPSAKGLFHRVISQSGSGQSIATPEVATNLTLGVLDKLGVDPSRLESLLALPFQVIAAATPGFIRPVVDGTIIPRGPFDPSAPSMPSRVPFLTGSTSTEVTFFNDTPLLPIGDDELATRLEAFTGQAADKVAALLRLYREHRPMAQNHDLYQVLASDWGRSGQGLLHGAGLGRRGSDPRPVVEPTHADANLADVRDASTGPRHRGLLLDPADPAGGCRLSRCDRVSPARAGGHPARSGRSGGACELQTGSWLAGTAVGRVPFGASHGLGHLLAGLAGVPHGLTSALLLPAVLDLNRPSNAKRQASCAAALGDVDAAAAVRRLIGELGLDRELAELQLDQASVDRICELATTHFVVGTNPVALRTPEAVRELLNSNGVKVQRGDAASRACGG